MLYRHNFKIISNKKIHEQYSKYVGDGNNIVYWLYIRNKATKKTHNEVIIIIFFKTIYYNCILKYFFKKKECGYSLKLRKHLSVTFNGRLKIFPFIHATLL